MSEKSGQFYNQVAGSYDRDYSSPYWRLYFDITWHNIKKFLPIKGSKILDAGGGTGIFGLKLAEMGYKVTILDISEGMLNQARIKAKNKGMRDVHFLIGDVRNLEYLKREHFDMVLCEGDVLSYCGDHHTALNALSRVLKGHGTIIASVDNIYATIKHTIETCNGKELEELRTLLETGTTSFFGKFPVKTFNADELKKDFERAGFKTMRIIGKPVLAMFLKRSEADNLLLDQKFYNSMVKLEKEYCDKMPFQLFGGHLEIVARKESTLSEFIANDQTSS